MGGPRAREEQRAQCDDQTRADDTILAASVATLSTLIEWCPSRQPVVQERRGSAHHNEYDAFLDSALESYLHFALLDCIDAGRRAATNIALLDTLQIMLCAQQQDRSLNPATDLACRMSQLLIRAGAYEVLLGLLVRSSPTDAAVQCEVMQVQSDAADNGAEFVEGSADFARVREVGGFRARSGHTQLHIAAAKTMYRLAESATHAKDGGPGNSKESPERVHFDGTETTVPASRSPLMDSHDVTGADVEESLVRALLLLLPNASDEIVQLLTLTLWWWAHSPHVRDAMVEAGTVVALTAEIRRGRFRIAVCELCVRRAYTVATPPARSVQLRAACELSCASFTA